MRPRNFLSNFAPNRSVQFGPLIFLTQLLTQTVEASNQQNFCPEDNQDLRRNFESSKKMF